MPIIGFNFTKIEAERGSATSNYTVKSDLKLTGVAKQEVGLSKSEDVLTFSFAFLSDYADAGSIRGDLSLSIQSNVVHSSDSVENGKAEVARFFKKDEIFDYKKSNFDYVYADEAF